VGAGISIIPHRQQFVKRKVVQKSKSLDARICALCHVDFWGGVWYTIIVKRESGESADPAQRTKKIQRNLKNPLDKSPKL
jgi:hypothetical protein